LPEIIVFIERNHLEKTLLAEKISCPLVCFVIFVPGFLSLLVGRDAVLVVPLADDGNDISLLRSVAHAMLTQIIATMEHRRFTTTFQRHDLICDDETVKQQQNAIVVKSRE